MRHTTKHFFSRKKIPGGGIYDEVKQYNVDGAHSLIPIRANGNRNYRTNKYKTGVVPNSSPLTFASSEEPVHLTQFLRQSENKKPNRGGSSSISRNSVLNAINSALMGKTKIRGSGLNRII